MIVAGLFEGEIVRRGQRQCKRGMLRSAGQDDTGEEMNLPCRREAEHHEPRSAIKFGFQILASCDSHKGGKGPHSQAKNLCCSSRQRSRRVISHWHWPSASRVIHYAKHAIFLGRCSHCPDVNAVNHLTRAPPSLPYERPPDFPPVESRSKRSQ